MSDENTNAYYKDKVVLLTGGGGSIGSELCRQLAKMKPKQIIIRIFMKMEHMTYSRN
ncbi:MAG: polysaccharide biosynthesis protein [[Ruminococcus] lactaris]